MTDFRFAKAAPCSDVLVAVDEAGDIIGSVMVGRRASRLALLPCAHPASRSKGVGGSMVEAAEHWLRQQGIAKIQLMVRETNTKVVSFDERLGFEVTPHIVMSRWLRDPA